MRPSDTERLKKMCENWHALQNELGKRSITKEMLLTDQFSQWAVTTPLYNIGEHAYQLSTEFKQQHSSIPWSLASGLRHRLVHDYDGINWEIIAEVLFEDMPEFISNIEKLLK